MKTIVRFWIVVLAILFLIAIPIDAVIYIFTGNEGYLSKKIEEETDRIESKFNV
ncbi:hypothetical protein [Winogradskyella sp.]|uniref:hypothetical protein n=1 Tax=Winogradskyella sp. TaxID=1883156 RepID=UPI003BAB0C8D